MFDVIIIGAGVIGASIARELSKYKLKTLVIEKNSDVCMETSRANSAIIHSGYDPHYGTLKAKFNSIGNILMEEVCDDLDVEFKRIGSLTIATNDEEVEMLYKLKDNAILNNVDVRLIDKDELFKIEPNITKKAVKALLADSCGIINPFELVTGLMENAIDNGVLLHLDEKVIDIKKIDTGFNVITESNSYDATVVINCAGLYSDEINNMINDKKEKIIPRKGEYYVLNHFKEPFINHTLFSCPSSKGKGVLISPTTSGNYLIGPSSEFVDCKDDFATDKNTLDNVIKEAYRLVDNIPLDKVIKEFSGLRSYHESNDFVINDTNGFINMLGIQSPGLASSQAIKDYAISLVNNHLELIENESFNPKRRPLYRLKNLTLNERNELIKNNPDFGKIVCRCENISLGEILDCIHRSCGARTINGVKNRVRCGFGLCQGGFCEEKVLNILAKELGKNPMEIFKSNRGSNQINGYTKGDNYE